MIALGVLAIAAGAVALVEALYLLLLAVAALTAGLPSVDPAPPRSRLAVVVPAHNEAQLIGRCLDSLARQTYPSGLFETFVVADNCTDATAAIARSSGATVLTRANLEQTGKGRALRWAFDQLLPGRPELQAVVVLDADSVAAPGLLRGLAARFEAGAEAVQADYLALEDGGGVRARLVAAAFLLFHRTRFSGRAALHLPCDLVGNGMLLSRHLLGAHPWDAFTSAEDLEYSVELRLAGISPAFAAGAVVRAPIASSGAAMRVQRLRWEGGRLHLLRTRLGAVLMAALRQRRWSLVDLAAELLTPPLGVLAAGAAVATGLAGVLVAVRAVGPVVLVVWLAAFLAVPAYVLVGLRAAHAPGALYRALLAAPLVVGAQMAARLHLAGGLHADRWERTPRRGPAARPNRPAVGGVPIDPLDVNEAVGRVMSAVRTGQFTQVCTVNLDFLAHARREKAVGSVLRESGLNLADGAPVVWLCHLLGQRIPGRVAGADFVPRLVGAAAAGGASVFFLGGRDGAGIEAARRMSELNPGLRVAGVCEPTPAELNTDGSAAVLERIRVAHPDVLLVALGHPKQEIWIHDHRHELPVAAAVGVGCTFDLICGRRLRAPGWMQGSGLEWLFRLLHEPRRLGGRYLVDAWVLMVVLLPATLTQRIHVRR